MTITATPAKHGVYEVTFVLRADPGAVYFAGDTLLIPELSEIPERLGHINVALLPTNGLRVRPANDLQVVMNADQAAQLAAVLRPELAIPHHYAFTSGWLGDRLVTKTDRDPQHYQDAAARLAAETTVRIVEPGVATSLFGDPAAGLCEDASARLREHPARLRLLNLAPVLALAAI